MSTKSLASKVSRLRGWVGTDESKTPELADALVELTAARLRARELADAPAVAQESFALAAKLLAANGPLGPYTPTADAVRLVTASIHMAVLETLAERLDSAATTYGSAEALIAALPTLPIATQVGTEASCWALIVGSRLAAKQGDAGLANARIDAAPAGVELQEFDRLATLSRARWLAGREDEALAAGWSALELLGAHPQSASARATLADLLAAIGDHEAAVGLRRDALAADPGNPVHERALADELSAAGRQQEAADLLAKPAVAAAPERARLERYPRIDWSPLPNTAPFAQTVEAPEVSVDVAAALAEQRRAEQARAREAELEAAQKAAEAAAQQRLEAERLAAEEAAAARQAELERLAAEEAKQAAIAESQRRREQRMAEHQAELTEQQKFDALVARVDQLRRQQAGPELVEALTELSQAMRERGEWWAARKPAKEARQLAKKLGI